MKSMRRDQRRAAYAYGCVRKVGSDMQDDYKIAVNALGPNVLRNGLAAALSFLERDAKAPATKQFFKDLAAAEIPGLGLGEGEAAEHALPEKARQLDLEDYMLASRELLLVAHWFKRAVQATFQDG